ncbi:ABC transporter substrate-binding protein [Devosia rhodophyticola]|uniref:ABC transporter substrate-binding protein n=1 Tax=Devosia rhodophyticola TaxID=3026423 RepID=A0ABY7YYV6_9HYPH|nr:ABC transporter substrate-binding protein [Devosia rhodophyticola]WDR06069.1 ABC transporter substrate-binding protein [Devosia rhodophyticola]
MIMSIGTPQFISRLVTTAGVTAIMVAGSVGAVAGKELLTLGATLDMYGWNPGNQPGYQNWAAEAVWGNLVKCNSVGGLEADMAESWEVSNGNRTFTAKLRPDLKFSDGSPVALEDVKASFEFLTTSGRGADYEDIEFEMPDAQTISLSWPEPQPILNNKICSANILPMTVLAAGNWDVPIGSGPYVLDDGATTTGSEYVFKKNSDHWNASDYPYDNLVIKVITADGAAVSALTTGQIDATLVAAGSLETVKAAGMEVIQFLGQTPRLIISDRTGAKIPALGDVRVRQAMNMVFDKAAMAEHLYLGNAEPTAQVYRKGTAAHIVDLEDPYPFDVEKARELMAEAGFADGFELEFPTMTGQNFETLLPYVRQQLALINIRVTEVPLSGANAISDLLSGKFPVVLWQLGNDGNSAFQIYVESTVDGWWNLQHVGNEFIDGRWVKIATASAEESAALQQEINRYVVDEAWFAPFVYMGSTYAFNPEKVSIPTQSDAEALTPKLRDFQ